MALHSVDKSNINGQSPSPNTPDRLITDAPPAHNTVSTHYSVNTPTGYVQMRNKQVIANDGTDNRANFGYNSGLNTWGFFVTKTGYDATSETSAANYVFNSAQDVFKIVSTGSSSCPSVSLSPSAGTYLSGTNNTAVAHGLSFVPLVIASGLYSAGIYSSLPITVNTGSSTHASWINYYVFADNTYVYFNTDLLAYGASASASSLSVKYWLLQETAN